MGSRKGNPFEMGPRASRKAKEVMQVQPAWKVLAKLPRASTNHVGLALLLCRLGQAFWRAGTLLGVES